jgi:hypothetical protein
MVSRGGLFVTVFGWNAAMWAMFTRSLQLTKSSVYVTVINTSANLIFTVRLYDEIIVFAYLLGYFGKCSVWRTYFTAVRFGRLPNFIWYDTHSLWNISRREREEREIENIFYFRFSFCLTQKLYLY